jgi:single-stranded DNA-binding protein
MTEHVGDLAVCELYLAVERPGPDRRTERVSVTCFGRLPVFAAAQLTMGDFVGVTGWLRTESATDDGKARQRIDVVAERLDFLGHPIARAASPDGHLEAAYDDRYELDEVP